MNLNKESLSPVLAGLFSLLFLCSFLSTAPQVFKGKASYYASKFEGRRTSSGEVFHHKLLTGAHKTLPFGTKVKVTNVRNDSVVVVKINDRLPRKSSRIIDLSRAAAERLNFIKAGLTEVKLEVMNE